MPYGTKDPSSYTTRRTSVIIKPKEPGKCCVCPKTNAALGPMFVKAIDGLIAVFVCQSCYMFHRQHPEFTYEMMMDRANGFGSNPIGKRTYTRRADVPNIPVLALGSTNEDSQIMAHRFAIIEAKLDKILALLSQAPSTSEPEKIVPEQTVSDSSKTVSEPKKPVRIRVTEHQDDDIEFGMTPEQKARMEEAVKVAKSREGTVIEAPSGW